ncbi:MAG: Holliday junction branch migration protein RuvA [Candidatus Wallbacteria bacterium]|nr:Holliday junction branch migration protein RuvA [Candidatus Wallbacteria bacterium]
MLRYLKGIIARKDTGRLWLECGGFGLEIHFPNIALDSLGSVGEEAMIYTELILRARESDGELELFGFSDQESLRLFKCLLQVSKIGPKMAMNLLSQLDTRQIISAIAESDLATLSGVSGIGSKTAERIVVELKDKIQKEFAPQAMTSKTRATEAEDRDLNDALRALGYTQGEIRKGLTSLNREISGRPLEEKIRLMLGALSK